MIFLPNSEIARKNEAAAWSAQSLVRGGGHHMSMLQRIGVLFARHKAGEVRHIDHEPGAYPIGNGAKPGKIDELRIGRSTRDNQLWPVFIRQPLNLIHVDAVAVAANIICDRPKPFAGKVHRGAVGEMSAGRQIQAHKPVAGLQKCEKYRLIGLRAGMGLHIRK